ncbi:MAG: response regulator [Bacteriovorax sp.]|nr:response regulator [Bacteriovorax sp.]
MKPSLNLREFIKYIVLSIIFGAIYFYVADLSLQITRNPGQTSAFFIPSGFAVAIMIVFGVRYIPVLCLAKFLLGLTNQRPIYMNLMSCLASVSEAYVGLYIYNSFKDSIENFFEFQSNLALVLLVSFIAPVFSALIGVTNLYYLGVVPETSYFSNVITWYAGDAVSIMIFLPAFLSFSREKHKVFDFVAPVLAFFCTYIFKFHMFGSYLFLIFSTILIPCLFGSVMGIYYSLMTVALVLNWFLINQIGPFSLGSYSDSMISMQFFLLALAISALAIDGFKRTNLLKSAIVPLLSFWLLTGAIYFYYNSQREISNNKIMADVIEDFEARLTEKMDFYENVVKGASGFVAASQNVEDLEWKEYVSSISIINKNNGVLGLALIFPKNIKSSGHIFVSPENLNAGGNLQDIFNHPELKRAFDEAVYHSTPVLTSAVRIKTTGEKRQFFMSFLITPVKKENKFIAWIVAPVLMEDFFKAMTETKYPAIDIDIYDGENTFKLKKIYSKVVDERLRNTEEDELGLSKVTLADRVFTIDWNETKRFVTSHSSQNSLFILFGAIFSIVVTGFILNLKLISVKANRIADSKTGELRESEEKFKSLFENSSDAVILFNQKIIDCNPESLRLFGKRSKKELLNTPLIDFFSIRDLDSDDNNLFQKKVKDVQYKKMVKFECFCLRTGLPFFAEIHLHYIEVNDKFIYQAVVRDISERKKIEQNLRKSKELAEDAAKAKTNFLSTMGHEICTPLNGVIGMINIILDENPKSDIREDLETIKYSADNLLHIVNEVLDYNKIESGNIILEKKLFSLKNLSESILKIHRPKAVEKNLQLLLEYDVKIPELVIGDEYRNTQILNNLLSNSLKFTESGDVTLSLRLKQKKEDSCIIEFKVRDTGIGIDKNKQREIFKDFTQAESDHTRKYGGTGLGLAITKRLVEIQNGKIDVNSSLGHGTSFIFTIHFNLRPEIPLNISLNSNQKAQDNFNNQRVLLVEDNQVNIIVTKKFLEKWGLKVDVAINGLEAVNHVRAIKYDLILMDLHMPLMDGLEATRKIREFNTYTPIIGLSADVMTESVTSLQSIGMNDFVTKPFRPNDFFIKLKSFI